MQRELIEVKKTKQNFNFLTKVERCPEGEWSASSAARCCKSSHRTETEQSNRKSSFDQEDTCLATIGL